MLYVFFWVISRRLIFVCQLPTRLWRWNRQCSETLEYKMQTPRYHRGECIQHSEKGEIL